MICVDGKDRWLPTRSVCKGRNMNIEVNHYPDFHKGKCVQPIYILRPFQQSTSTPESPIPTPPQTNPPKRPTPKRLPYLLTTKTNPRRPPTLAKKKTASDTQPPSPPLTPSECQTAAEKHHTTPPSRAHKPHDPNTPPTASHAPSQSRLSPLLPPQH